jgi:hypothetical protein
MKVTTIKTETGSRYFLREEDGKVLLAGVNVENPFSVKMPEDKWYQVAALFSSPIPYGFQIPASIVPPFPSVVPDLAVGHSLVVAYLLDEDDDPAAVVTVDEPKEGDLRVRSKRTSPIEEIKIWESDACA